MPEARITILINQVLVKWSRIALKKDTPLHNLIAVKRVKTSYLMSEEMIGGRSKVNFARKSPNKEKKATFPSFDQQINQIWTMFSKYLRKNVCVWK